ncbi:hypothetical protein ACVOMV_19770 [Mesorhizobium atlanticum]
MRSDLARLLGGVLVAIVLLVIAIAATTLWIDRRERVRHESDAATGGTGARAVPIMTANGCSGCHTIPGVPGRKVRLGRASTAALPIVSTSAVCWRTIRRT